MKKGTGIIIFLLIVSIAFNFWIAWKISPAGCAQCWAELESAMDQARKANQSLYEEQQKSKKLYTNLITMMVVGEIVRNHLPKITKQDRELIEGFMSEADPTEGKTFTQNRKEKPK